MVEKECVDVRVGVRACVRAWNVGRVGEYPELSTLPLGPKGEINNLVVR